MLLKPFKKVRPVFRWLTTFVCFVPMLSGADAEPSLAEWVERTEIVSGGFGSGNQVRVAVDGRVFFEDVPRGPATAGLYVVAINESSVLFSRHYNTYMRPGAGTAMKRDFEELPEGAFVVVAVKDEATRHFGEDGAEALRLIGAATGLQDAEYRTSYYCMGLSGADPGVALERVGMKMLRHVGQRTPTAKKEKAERIAEIPEDERPKLGGPMVKVTVRRENGVTSLKWTYPERLTDAFNALSTHEEWAELGASEMLKQAAGGDRESEYKLGYLYLYGLGVPRDFKEAERRFRLGLEMERPMGARRLAWELIQEENPEFDPDIAAEMALGALGLGYEKAIPAANKIGYHLAWEAEPRDPVKALELFKAVLALEPDRGDSLRFGAIVAESLGDYDAAWEWGSRLVSKSDATDRERFRGHSIRLKVAQATGRVGELERADLIEPFLLGLKRMPRGWVGGFVAGFGLIGSLTLAFMVWRTRRAGERGLGFFISSCWVAVPALGAGIWIHFPAGALIVEFVLIVTMLAALPPALRRRYLPIRGVSPREGFGALGAVLGCFAALVVAGLGYGALYERLVGHEIQPQLLAVYLDVDGPFEAFVMFFMIAICAPLLEEIAFRGFLVDWFRRRMAWSGAVFFVALLFGVVHGWVAAFPVFLIGLATGWLRFRYGNIWPAIALHALNNGLAVLAFWALA